MIALILIMVGIAALGIAAALDLTPDTRDPAYGLGPFFSPLQHLRWGGERS
jgi:hypothetical protein